MQWNKTSEKLPVFDDKGWSHNLLFWDGDTLYSGSCQNRGGNPVFIDWWVGGCDVDAQWWAPWPKKPTADNLEGANLQHTQLAIAARNVLEAFDSSNSASLAIAIQFLRSTLQQQADA